MNAMEKLERLDEIENRWKALFDSEEDHYNADGTIDDEKQQRFIGRMIQIGNEARMVIDNEIDFQVWCVDHRVQFLSEGESVE